MTHDDPLFRLSRRAGIFDDYWDVRGQRHPTSRQTAVAVLSALGIAAASADEIETSLRLLEEEDWRETLPPVAVFRQGDAASVPVVAEDGRSSGVFRLQLEGGEPRALSAHLEPTNETYVLDGRICRRLRLGLPQLPCGYHRLLHDHDGGHAETVLIVAPGRCYLPPALEQQRVFGITTQLYALRRPGNLGIGDFTDLDALISWSQQKGAAAVGLNPLHSLFPTQPDAVSPYSPNSRQFLNPLYLDVTRVQEFATCGELRKHLSSIATSETSAMMVDYEAVSRLKSKAFEMLYSAFSVLHRLQPANTRVQEYDAFVAERGEPLRRFALHATLCEQFATCDWTQWPAIYHDPASAACREFSGRHTDRLHFHMYLQWQCEQQLKAAAGRARDMAVGIYGDLAVSSSPDGADVWAGQTVFATAARIGAPPDPLAERGQEWGVVPMNPRALRRTAYRDVIALLRANMRHFGALRIDHAMELERLFWIPRGLPPGAGTYVAYPFADLAAIVALESVRNRCLVIGEDLGTVPEGFRETLNAQNIFSYRVLYFEEEGGRYKAPAHYPQNAAACVSTHDLPTLRGFWEEHDIRDRQRAGQFADDEEMHAAQRERRKAKAALLAALAEAELLPQAEPFDSMHLSVELAAALHQFLARAPCRLMMVQLDDLAGEKAQINMPGTTDSYPNWRRSIHQSLEELDASELAGAILSAIRSARA
ncbi:MAG: 4-alpha-glucanotransferase [Alphaproteobacteria bacterium]|nr:4-alpha-glucanotransferase [Alphaproteobacteria bacterium]